jgi:glycosyltransferase involved in cell wall biosynthesis
VGVKILILHQHFKIPREGGAIRSYYLARALVQAGHDVVVLAGHNGDYANTKVKDIDVHWLPVSYDNRFNFTNRSKSFIKYVYQAIRKPQLFRDADLCYAISVPLTTGLAALWIKRWFGIPYIFEVGDLWPDAPVQLGFIKNSLFKRFLHALERRIYSGAASIVALSVPIRAAIESRVKGKSIHLIPNMADTCYYRPMEKDDRLERYFGVEGRFVVLYAGALGFANGLEYILGCARACQLSQLPVTFLICGDGAEEPELRHTSEQWGLQNVKFIPFKNRDGVKEVMAITDAVFVCYRPIAILETGSPNKYFDGLSAGKLIVVNFSGWIREEVERSACGIHVDPGDPNTFVHEIRPFMDDPQLLDRYQRSARNLAEQEYSRNELGRQFVQAVTG